MGYLGRNPAIGTQKVLDSLESQFNGTLTTFDLRYNGTPTYPTLSESLIVSLGGVLQEPGEAYYISSDTIVFAAAPPAGSDCWILLYSEYGAAAGSGSSGGAVSVATGEPMGFEERTDSAISFDNATRTFTIEPASGISEFVVWTKGTKRTYSSAQTVQIGTTTGLYYIYFDAFGVLQYRTTYFIWDEDTPTAYVYWNATTATGVFVADERHGIVLDWQTHEYLHRTRGAVIANGFSISNYTTTGNGGADADAQFDLGNGTFFDEDLEVGITHSATPSAGTFTQVLTGNAEIPVYYMSGSEGDWVKDAATEFACKQSGTTLQYNLLSGNGWSTTSANDNRYVVSWVVATNEISAPVIVILGQDQYSSIGTAEEAVWGDLTLTNFPIFEFRPLWKIIFRTNSTFTNTPNAHIANVLDLREFSSTGIAGTIVNDHGLLSGLADDDHAQYLNTTIDRTGVTANISTTGNITAANLIATGQLQGPANFVIDPAAVGDDTGNVEIKGNLTVQGTTTTINSTTVDLDHLSLGDNEIANFGAGDDLQIYHSGTHNFINSAGSADLYVRGANILLQDHVNSNRNWLVGLANGTLELYHSGNKKFETTTTGVNITGTLKVNNIASLDSTTLSLGLEGGANGFINTQESLYVNIDSNNDETGKRFEIRHGATDASGTQLFTVLDSGNVGIGTDNPTSTLMVYGDTSASYRIAKSGILAYDHTFDGSTYTIANNNGSGGIPIILGSRQAGAETLRMNANGSVGIGNATASSGTGRFNVKPHDSQDSYFKIRPASDFDGLVVGSAIDIRNGANNDSHHLIARAEEYRLWCGDSSGEKIRITNTGNVGIGTNSPVAKFNVNGQSVFNSTESSNESNVPLYLAVEAIASVADGAGAVCPGVLRIKDKGANNNRFCGIDIRNRNSGDIRILNYDTNTANQADMVFAVDVDSGDGIVEAMRIKGSTQNVGIGTITPSGKLEVAGTIVQSSIEYPTIRPVLDLNFAATKTLDRRITFTRDGVGTYYDELGVLRYASNNVPRFDHDSTTGESLGLLIEESRTNLVIYSNRGEGLNGAPYYGNWNAASYTNNFAVAPDGTTTAWKFRPTTPSSSRVARVSVTAGNTYTFSVWLKKDPSVTVSDGVWDYFKYLITWSQNGSTVTSAATVPLVSGSTTSAELTTKWRRFSVSYVAPANMTSMEFGISNANSGSGDPGYSVFVWGAQVEEGAFATSYIPTTGSTVTRAADNAVIKGTNFTDFYNSTEGTLVSEHMGAGNANASPYIAMLSDGTNNERIIIMSDYADYQMVVKENGANQAILDAGTPNLNVKNKNATAFKKDDFALSLNGGTVATDTSGNMSVVNQLWIGSRNGADSYMNNTIQSLKYYNKRLPNAQLQGLTYL